MKIQKRTIYVIKFKDDNGIMQELQFSTRQLAIVWLNRAILDYGRYDAHLVTRRVA